MMQFGFQREREIESWGPTVPVSAVLAPNVSVERIGDLLGVFLDQDIDAYATYGGKTLVSSGERVTVRAIIRELAWMQDVKSA